MLVALVGPLLLEAEGAVVVPVGRGLLMSPSLMASALEVDEFILALEDMGIVVVVEGENVMLCVGRCLCCEHNGRICC